MRMIPIVKNEKQTGNYVEISKKISIKNDFSTACVEVFTERMETRGISVCMVNHEDMICENPDMLLKLQKGEVAVACPSECMAETYQISITKEGIVITAPEEIGVIWGLTTLYLLTEVDKKTKSVHLPITEIIDAPSHEYRGLHLDCARHFIDVEETKKVIEEISLVKINRLHWHLCDDQGWRIEIEKYPKLHEQCNGQYYTKAQIKEIVAYAAARGITIHPELDMPGHTRAMTAAYPSLSCFEKEVGLVEYGGIFPEILCPGKEETFAFVQDVLDEVLPLFPSEYYHEGGDEAPKNEWKKCPCCQSRMKELGLSDEIELQGYFIKRIADYVKEKYGKKIIGWHDCLDDSKTMNEIIMQYWGYYHEENFPEFVEKGGKFIYSNMFELYYDYVSAMSPMKRSYTFTPMVGEMCVTNHKNLLGYEACTWSEYITDADTLEKRIFPRIYALAERAWSEPDAEYYEDFTRRLLVFQKEFSKVTPGSGDPKGIRKMIEKMKYAITMSQGMPEEVRKQTVEAASVSEEFKKKFADQMMR